MMDREVGRDKRKENVVQHKTTQESERQWERKENHN